MSANNTDLERAEGSLPLFVVPGMPRAGTTFLYHNLQKHPQIFLPFRKEIDYFNEIYHYRGISWYHSLYREIKEGQVAGDLSPTCWFSENAMAYMEEYNPNIKIILSVRNPAEFAVSLYIQKLSSDYDLPASIDEFIKEGYFLKMTKRGDGVRFSFNTKSYIETIESYKDTFGENLLMYDFRLFRKDTLVILKKIESFLGLEPWFKRNNYDNLRINESYRRNIKVVNWLFTQEWLRDIVEKYVQRRTAMLLRGFIDRISVRTKPTENMANTHKAEALATAKKYLSESCEYYEKLFENNQIFLGDGTIIDE